MGNKTIITAVLSAVIGFSLPPSVYAGEMVQDNTMTKPELIESGTVEVQAKQVRLIVGGSKGTGVLHFGGKDYKFKMSGNSLGGAGITKVDAAGTVYNLNSIEDFPGTYSGMGVGAAVGKGTGASSWKNDKGVVVNMQSKSTDGVALNMGINVVTIELVK